MEKNSKFVFDKNINSFSPEGRLYQVEYSIKASEISGSTCIATKGFDTICVIEDKKKIREMKQLLVILYHLE